MEEREEIVNITFPIYFSTVYSDYRKVQRVEMMLEIFTTLSSFFNKIVAGVVADLVTDGRMSYYEHDLNDEDDEIVMNKFRRVFRQEIANREFGWRLLDDLGLSGDEIRNAMKILAVNLVEDSLSSCYEHICEEALENKMRLSRVLELSAVDEFYGDNGLPIRFTIEATIALDSFKRIGR